MKWRVELLDERVAEEIARLPDAHRAKFLRIAELLQDLGPQRVGGPYIRHLDGRLWEIRIAAKGGISRAIYVTVSGARIVVVRAFVKKTQKTPRHELAIARERAKEVSE